MAKVGLQLLKPAAKSSLKRVSVLFLGNVRRDFAEKMALARNLQYIELWIDAFRNREVLRTFQSTVNHILPKISARILHVKSNALAEDCNLTAARRSDSFSKMGLYTHCSCSVLITACTQTSRKLLIEKEQWPTTLQVLSRQENQRQFLNWKLHWRKYGTIWHRTFNRAALILERGWETVWRLVENILSIYYNSKCVITASVLCLQLRQFLIMSKLL